MQAKQMEIPKVQEMFLSVYVRALTIDYYERKSLFIRLLIFRFSW